MGTVKTSQVLRGWGQGNERVEHRGFLGPQDYPVRPYNNASVLLCFFRTHRTSTTRSESYAHNRVSDARGPTHVHGFRQTYRLVRTPIMGWTVHVCMQGGVGDTPLPSPQLCYEPKTVLKNRHYFGAPWLAQSEEREAHDLRVPRSSPTLCIDIILKNKNKEVDFLGEKKRNELPAEGEDRAQGLAENNFREQG